MQAAPVTNPPKYKGFWDCGFQVYKTEGIKGFIKGFSPCILRYIIFLKK